MKKRKRILAAILCPMLVLSMAACGKSEKTTESSKEGDVTESVSTEEVTTEAYSSGDAEIDEIMSKMTVKDKVEQMMIVTYRIWKKVPDDADSSGNTTVENSEEDYPEINVTELNDVIREDLLLHHYGGTILFSENCQNAEQTLKLVCDIQQTAVQGGGLPLIVAADQEGGTITRLGYGTSGVGNMALAATGDPENAKTMASIYGNELKSVGINADYAPVMDVNNNPNNPVIGTRSFSDDPNVVAQYGVKYMEGLHDTGTMATLKHFPGHGNTDTDSHTGFPCINSTLDELRSFELVPFQKAIDAGADMVMTAHIQYPQIEKETYTSVSTGEEVYLPATLSHTILTDVLRDEMGFEGVVVTDALDMGAISENFKDEDIVRLAINGGADMLILPIITDTAIFNRVKTMTETAIRLVEDGTIDMKTINDSVARILKMKKKYGLLDRKDFTVTDEMLKAADSVGSPENRSAEWAMAEKAITLLKNDDAAFPIKMEEGQKTLVLIADCCGSRIETPEIAKKKLVEEGVLTNPDDVTTMLHSPDENEEECLKAAEEADHLILIYRVYDTVNLDPTTDSGLSLKFFDEVIAKRHEVGKKVILISIQLPYDAARFTEADAILLAYDSAPMRELPPETGEGSAYVPNLAVAIYKCFGDGNLTGKLPVNIMKLDEAGKVTDEVLFERQQ